VLSEVQQICTRVAIINHGKLVRVAPVAELLDSPGEFAIQVDSPDALVSVFGSNPGVRRLGSKKSRHHSRTRGSRADLIAYLVQNGHTPDSVSERQRDLEDIFLSLTEAIREAPKLLRSIRGEAIKVSRQLSFWLMLGRRLRAARHHGGRN